MMMMMMMMLWEKTMEKFNFIRQREMKCRRCEQEEQEEEKEHFCVFVRVVVLVLGTRKIEQHLVLQREVKLRLMRI